MTKATKKAVRTARAKRGKSAKPNPAGRRTATRVASKGEKTTELARATRPARLARKAGKVQARPQPTAQARARSEAGLKAGTTRGEAHDAEAQRAHQARERGRALRNTLPRSGQGKLVLPTRRDPVAVLQQQNRNRLADLVPVRIGRMLQSPFAYYRGTAGQMASDLAAGPHSDVFVVACGDAHISNFGFFASPERKLLFDLNDFDEAGVAPWEWDVKRLAASVHVGGRDLGFTEMQCHEATRQAAQAYQTAIGEFMQLSALERYYFQVNTDEVDVMISDTRSRRLARKVVRKARERTSMKVLSRITTRSADGKLVIVDQPPLTRHVDHATIDQMNDLFAQYRTTVREDASVLLSQFEIVDVVLRVVGVGSVGTRCYVILLTGQAGEPLILQAKEAQASVLVTYGGMPSVVVGRHDAQVRTEGHRVVAAQRVLQAQSDSFLGWITGWAGDRKGRPPVDYYWRQFRDMKGSVDLSMLNIDQYTQYVDICARLLGRAHAQSPTAYATAGYLGDGGPFAEAIADWAAAYADVVEADFKLLEAAVANGKLPAERNV